MLLRSRSAYKKIEYKHIPTSKSTKQEMTSNAFDLKPLLHQVETGLESVLHNFVDSYRDYESRLTKIRELVQPTFVVDLTEEEDPVQEELQRLRTENAWWRKQWKRLGLEPPDIDQNVFVRIAPKQRKGLRRKRARAVNCCEPDDSSILTDQAQVQEAQAEVAILEPETEAKAEPETEEEQAQDESEEEEAQDESEEEEEEEEEEEDEAQDESEEEVEEAQDETEGSAPAETEEDEEVFEVVLAGKTYYTNHLTHGTLYAVDKDGDPGDEVGKFVNGKAQFASSK
jgi:cobalamin biosynthesis protein CobT